MPGKYRSNPYRDLSRESLHRAAQERAGELMNSTTKRTPEERTELALDTAYLLLALATFAANKEFVGGFSPQKSIRTGESFAGAFAKYFEELEKTARYAVYTEAGDLALGEESKRSLPDREAVRALYHQATESNEGLMVALEKMQEMHQRKKK